MKFFQGSWRTTVSGYVGGLLIILTQVQAVIDTDPTTVFSLVQFGVGLSMLSIGWFARDNNKSSEVVGAKKP